MKKIIVTILTLTVIISSAACNKTKTPEPPSTSEQSINNIKKAEETAKKFMDEICASNINEAKKYVYNPEVIPEKISDITSLKDYAKNLSKELPQDLKEYEKDFSKLFGITIDEFSKILSYKIVGSEEKDNNVVVTIKFISPSEEQFENVGEDISTESKKQIKIIAEEAFYDGKITELSSDEETLEIIMPELFSYLNNYIVDFIENLETESTTIELTVSKQNDKWQILLGDITD